MQQTEVNEGQQVCLRTSEVSARQHSDASVPRTPLGYVSTPTSAPLSGNSFESSSVLPPSRQATAEFQPTNSSIISKQSSSTNSLFSSTRHPVDILFEMQEVLVQEFDCCSGQPLLPCPQPSVLVLSFVQNAAPKPLMLAATEAPVPLPQTSSEGDALMLLGNYKITLNRSTTICQLSKYVFDVILGPGQCLRILLPADTPADDLEALPSLLQCYATLRALPNAMYNSDREPYLDGRGTASEAYAKTGAAQHGALVPSPDGGGILIIPPPPSMASSTAIASNVGYYGRLASSYITWSTTKAVGGIGAGADLLVASTQRYDQPVSVPSSVKAGIEGGQYVAQTAASITGSLAAAVVGAAGYVGYYTGSAVARALVGDGTSSSPSAISNVFGEPAAATAGAMMRPVIEVGAAVVGSGAMVISSVFDAKEAVIDAAKGGVSKVVTHKLGPEVGEAAGGVMETARLGAEVAFIGSSKKVKRAALLMAARVAKQAADTAVDEKRRLEQDRLTIALRPGGGGQVLAITDASDVAMGITSPLLIEVGHARSASRSPSPANAISPRTANVPAEFPSMEVIMPVGHSPVAQEANGALSHL